MIKDLARPGHRVLDPNQVNGLKQAVHDFSGRRRDLEGRFPGSQPVTFQSEHVNMVKPRGSYVVCEKSDGCRYLLLMMTQHSYLVSTKLEFYRVDPPLPIRLDYAKETLLDGELVIDVVDPEDETKNETNFYVFDALCIRGRYVGDFSLTNRLRLAAGEIIACCDPMRTMPTPMFLKLKKMYAASAARYVWEKIIQGGKLHHESDGLIFTQDPGPYVLGTCYRGEILKWKPPHLNSVDFGIAPIVCVSPEGQEERYFCKLFWANSGRLEEYRKECILLDEDTQRMFRQQAVQGGQETIITECWWDPNWINIQPPTPGSSWEDKKVIPGGGWRFMRLRVDKPLPNAKRTVESVIHSIRNPLNEEDLFQALEGNNE